MMAGAREGSERPLVAVIANVHTPYRAHLHARIVREMPEIELASLYTHDEADQPWAAPIDPAINPVKFGSGEPARQWHDWRTTIHDWKKAGRIARWLEEHRAAAVLVCGYNDMTRLRIIAWCRRRGIPCFVVADSNIRGDFARGFKRWLKARLVGWVVRTATGVMPCGTLGAQYFASYGATPEQTFFHPYEPDYALIRSIPRERIEEAMARFALAPGRRRIVVCARLVPWKRVDLAIKAFAAIAADRPEWDLVIIGDGPQREELKQMAPEGLGPRIVWAGFIGDQSMVSAVYRASDVLLCPSDFEPWAVVINEAAAAGLAIIASDVVGAAAELVRDGVNGGVFPAGDQAALTAIVRKVTDPAAIDGLKAGSEVVLADWQRRGDPVQGLRAALVWANVLHHSGRFEEVQAAGGEPALRMEPYPE